MKLLSIICMSLLLFINQGFAQTENIEAKIDKLANDYISKKKTRALTIAYIYNGKEIVKYYGETEAGNNKLPNNTSIFQIGSATKVFTSTLLAQFEQKQFLSIDDDIKKFLPSDVILPFYQKLICKPDRNAIRVMDDPDFDNVKFSPYICIPDPKSVPPDVRLCYLASHTSGFPLNPSNLHLRKNKTDPYKLYDKKALYDYLKSYTLMHSFGTEYKYSNTGYALLGHALALNRKSTIDNLYSEYIFKKLEMTQSGFAFNTSMDLNIIQGHSKSGKPVNPYHFDAMAPAIGMHSTLGDMMKFLKANMQLKSTVLDDAMQLAQKPRLSINKKGLKNSQMALGWYISPLNSKNVVWHSGSSAGHSAFIGFFEGSKSGVVVLVNNQRNITPLAKEILSLLN